MDPVAAIDSLVILIVAVEQAGELTQRLVGGRFYFTRVESGGGLIQKPSVSLLIGIPHSRKDDLLRVVRTCCQKRLTYIPARVDPLIPLSQPVMIEAEIGGAVVYGFDVERFEQI
jgi:uncharacterized protein YaaQ